MPDLLVSAGIDLPALSRDFARAAQLGREFSAQLDRLQVAARPPQVNGAAFQAAGAQAGAAFAAGVSRQVGGGNAFAGIQTQALRARDAIAAAFAVRSVVGASDEFTGLNNRLESLTGSAESAGSAYRALFTVAQDTRTSVTASVDLYAKLGQATRGSGLSALQLQGYVTTLNQSFAVAGTSAVNAAQAIGQLGQAFSKGSLNSDELVTIREQAPQIIRAIQDVTGATGAEFAKMAEAGQITTEVILRALDRIGPATARQFAALTPTIGGGLAQVRNAFVDFIGEAGQSSGAAQTLAGSLSLVARNFDTVATAAAAAGAVAFARSVGPGTVALLAATRAQVAGYGAVEAAAVRAAAGAVAAADSDIAAASAARTNAAAQIAAAQARQGALAQELATAQATARLAATEVARTEAAARAVVIEGELAAVRGVLATETRAAAAAEAAGLGAATARAAALTGLGAAQTAASASALAGGVALRAFNGALGLVGGPVGAAVLALGGLVYALNQVKSASDETRDAFRRALDAARQSAANLPAIQVNVDIVKAQANLEAANAALRRVEEQARATNRSVVAAGSFGPQAGGFGAAAAPITASLQRQNAALREARANAAAASAAYSALAERQRELNTAGGRTGQSTAAFDAEVQQLAKLRDLGELQVADERRRVAVIAQLRRDLASLPTAAPVGSDAAAVARLRQQRAEIRENLNALTRELPDVRARVRLDAREARAEFARFRADAESAGVRLELAVALNDDPGRLQAVDALRASYARVAAEANRPDLSGSQRLTLLREQVAQARQLAGALRDAVTAAGERVEISVAVGGLDTRAQEQSVASLRSAYQAVTQEIAAQGGPLRASVELVRAQQAAADTLADSYRRAVQASRATPADLVAAPDPGVVAALNAVRDALAAVEAARAAVRPFTLGVAAGDTDALTTQAAAAVRLQNATDAAASAQAAFGQALRGANLPLEAQRRAADAADQAIRDAGLSTDALADRLVALARLGSPTVAPRFVTPGALVLPAPVLPAPDARAFTRGVSALAGTRVELDAPVVPAPVLPDVPPLAAPEVGRPVVPAPDLTAARAAVADLGRVAPVIRVGVDVTGPPVNLARLFPAGVQVPVTAAVDLPSAGTAAAELVAAVQTGARALPPINVRAAAGLDATALEAGLLRVQQLVSDIAVAQVRVDVAGLAGLPAESVAATAALRALQQAGDGAVREVARLAVLSGQLSPEQAERLRTAVAGLRAPASGAASALRQVGDTARSIGVGIQGIANAAGAFGSINQETQAALQGLSGLVNGIGEVQQALAGLRAAGQAANLGNLLGSAAGFSGIVGAIGGAAALLSGLFNRGPSPAELAIQRNVEATDRLRAELLNVRGTFAQLGAGQDAARAAALSPRVRDLALLTGAPNFGGTPERARALLEAELQRLGVSFRELQALAQQNGLSLLDDKGRVVAAAFGQLAGALDLVRQRALQLDTSLSGVTERLSVRANIYDTPDVPVARFASAIAALAEVAQGTDLARAFDGINVGTSEGRAIAEATIRRLFEQVQTDAGALTLLRGTDFTSLTEFLGLLGTIDTALDGFETATQGAAAVLTRFADGLAGQRDRLALRDELFTPGQTGAAAAVAAIQRELTVLRQLAPSLGTAFADLDATPGDTAAERATILAGLRDLFARIDTGALTAADLGQLGSVDELVGVIRAVNGGLGTLEDALNQAAGRVLRFADDLAGQRDLATLRDEIAGGAGRSAVDAAYATISREFALLATLAPRIAAQLGAIDATPGSTAAEAASIRQALAALVERAAAGALTAEDLGRLAGLPELVTIVRGVNGGLTSLQQASAEAAGALTDLGNVPQAFKRAVDQAAFNATARVTAPIPASLAPVAPLPATAAAALTATAQAASALGTDTAAAALTLQGLDGAALAAGVSLRGLDAELRIVREALAGFGRGLAAAPAAPTAAPTPTPTPTPYRPDAYTPGGGAAAAPAVVYAPVFQAGSVVIHTEETDGEALLRRVDGAVIQRATTAGGRLHPAAAGLVAALGVR